MSPVSRGKILPYAKNFAIDLHTAFIEQLPKVLNGLKRVPLTLENLEKLGSERGIYQLFYRGKSVYVGKSEQILQTRLRQHRARCMGRVGIGIDDMTFKCIYLDEFAEVAAPESRLIRMYRELGLASWNYGAGFAPKDPGRERGSGVPGSWFIDHPPNYDALVEVSGAGVEISLLDALGQLKEAVPFDLFRFASSRSRAPEDRDSTADYRGRTVTLENGEVPLMRHLERITRALPAGWQITVLPTGVIIYRENIAYAYAIDGWKRTTAGVERLRRGVRLPPVNDTST